MFNSLQVSGLQRHVAFLEVALTESDAICPAMMGRWDAGGVTTALTCVETRLDSKDNVPARVQPLNAVVFLLADSDEGTPDKIRADVIMRK